ncbi:MAG: DUF1018 domain-containing protein [Brevinematales bacterium]|nr:DUF1018 domain-containing protein [Brevinematales bacterium]
MLNRRAYARIHKLLKKRGITDIEYRKILHENFGVKSSKDLAWPQFPVLMRKLREYGSASYQTEEDRISLDQHDLLMELITDVGIFNSCGYVSKIIRRNISSLGELTKKEAATAIHALKRMKEKRNKGL